jgi:hypothetical protein
VSTRIPKADAPGALAVTDGAVTVGSIVVCDGSFFAFDYAGVLAGQYPTQIAAMRAIPTISSRDDRTRRKPRNMRNGDDQK